MTQTLLFTEPVDVSRALVDLATRLAVSCCCDFHQAHRAGRVTRLTLADCPDGEPVLRLRRTLDGKEDKVKVTLKAVKRNGRTLAYTAAVGRREVLRADGKPVTVRVRPVARRLRKGRAAQATALWTEYRFGEHVLPSLSAVRDQLADDLAANDLTLGS